MRVKVAFSLLVFFCLSTSWAQKESDTSDAASVGIKQALSDWSSAFNRHDPHGTAQAFVEDADMVSLAGIGYHGRKAIEAHYVKTFSTTLTNANRTDTVKSIRFLSPEVAAVEDAYEIVGSTSKTPGDNSVVPPRRGIFPLIYVKQNGQWLIAVSHEIEFDATAKK
jgi:uncharacterized protein (TIGR02246 family)